LSSCWLDYKTTSLSIYSSEKYAFTSKDRFSLGRLIAN